MPGGAPFDPTLMVTPGPSILIGREKVPSPEVKPMLPELPERYIPEEMVTSCPGSNGVWVVKLTATDLPVAPGMRSAVAMAKDTDEIWPPSAGAAPVPGTSVDVDTVTPLAEAAVIPPMVAPVRVTV